MNLLLYLLGLLIFLVFFLLFRIKRLSEEIKFKTPKKDIGDSVITSSQGFETILKSVSDGVLIIDPKGVIILSNQSFRDILKIDEPPEGKQVMEVIRNIDLLNLIRSATSTKEEVTQDITIKKAGKDIEILAKAMPVIASDNSVQSLIIFLHDITRIKYLENIRRDFVANVSHELKTPLTAIKGYAETLIDGALYDRENALKFIEIIKNQSERLTALVDDLLTLSSIEFGEINLDKKNIKLNEIVDSVFQIFKEKAEGKGLYLEKDIPADIVIYADRDRLMQILINLVDNAVKFTETGGVKLKYYKDNSNSIFSVEDTGIGIPKAHLHRIGERFYRVDKARSRQLGGTGLGLAIVKHLVKAHGWELKIESESAKGTKVKIVIPSDIQDTFQ